jgi:hypothetical protein
LVARFLQEARSASRIGHENVIDIMDFGQSPDGLVYIAMEFLDGKDLGEIVRGKGAMEWSEARGIVLQICRALRAAHDKGIVHRDMKPENIFLIQREGQPHFVKILDFGIAKVMGLDPNGPRLTRTGMIFGTPEYMAPEQAEGKDTDHRADIYAVGCIMYHLITGQTPFVAESFMTMLTKHLMEEPVPPSARRPDLVITPEMDALVLKALEKDRDKRWQSMAELLEAVAVCPGPETATPKPPGGQTVAMGGAHAAAALKILRSKGSAPETERVSRKAVDSAFPARNGLAAAGLAGQDPDLGDCRRCSGRRGCGLVGPFARQVANPVVRRRLRSRLCHHPQSRHPPPVPAPPPPQPAAELPAPAVAPVAEADEPSAEPSAKHGTHGHKGKPSQVTAKHATPGTSPAVTAAGRTTGCETRAEPATPGELKPFPKL